MSLLKEKKAWPLFLPQTTMTPIGKAAAMESHVIPPRQAPLHGGMAPPWRQFHVNAGKGSLSFQNKGKGSVL